MKKKSYDRVEVQEILVRRLSGENAFIELLCGGDLHASLALNDNETLKLMKLICGAIRRDGLFFPEPASSHSTSLTK